MGAVRRAVFDGSPNPRQVYAGDLEMGGENILNGSLVTIGAGTWTAALIANGIIYRTGPTGGYTDTTDTAVNILAALAGNSYAADVAKGSTFRLLYINTVAQAMTAAQGAGVVAGTGTLNCAASLIREYLFTVLSACQVYTLQGTLVSGSAAVVFVLPPGRSGFNLGPSVTAINLEAGATVTGTNVPTGTTILGLAIGQAGLTGITLSANATGSGISTLTIGPTLQIDTLGTRGL